jgi:hypothetical protein
MYGGVESEKRKAITLVMFILNESVVGLASFNWGHSRCASRRRGGTVQPFPVSVMQGPVL